MVKVKAEIIVKGKVQKVGYRDLVQEIARSLNVKGYAENRRDGTAKIVCETDENTLKNFIKQIKIKEDLIAVEDVEVVKTQPATGKYKCFDIKYGPLEEEIGERMVAALKIAVATRQDIKNMHHDMRDMHQDLKGSITSMHQDLKESINSMHHDMNRHFEEMAKRYDIISAELLRTREELKRSVDNLVKLIQKFLEKET